VTANWIRESTADGELAAQLAEDAGKLLLALSTSGSIEGRALGDAGDRAANSFLIDALRKARPDDGLLSEEMKCDGDRLSKSRVWIIDPVDGTREYGEGRADWAVHVGLAINGAAHTGAVALPALGITLRSDQPKLMLVGITPPRMVVSRSRPAQEAIDVAKAIDATLLPMGSAGAKAMAVVRGDAEIYLHTGGQNEWDNCAPAAVAMAHGLHCSRMDGSALRYNQADPSLPDLLICRSEWAAPVLALINGKHVQ
jgi:3'(2'), 5'-bisphosphate nucleotidase